MDTFQDFVFNNDGDMDMSPVYFEDAFGSSIPMIQDNPSLPDSFMSPEPAAESAHSSVQSDEAPLVLSQPSFNVAVADAAHFAIRDQHMPQVPDAEVSPSPAPTINAGGSSEDEPNTQSPVEPAPRSGAFLCEVCGLILSRRDALIRHCRVKHEIGEFYYCREPQCTELRKGYTRLRDFKRHMLVDHNNEITAEEAGAYKEVRHTSESLRAGSAGSELQYQLPVDNGNGYRAGPIQAHPHQNQQFFMNANQTSVHAMQQPAAYPVANYTGNPQHPMAPQQMWNGAQAVDLNNPQQLVQLLEARTSDNRVLHQHIVELQQQLEGMTLERDRYAAAYTQLRQRYGDN